MDGLLCGRFRKRRAIRGNQNVLVHVYPPGLRLMDDGRAHHNWPRNSRAQWRSDSHLTIARYRALLVCWTAKTCAGGRVLLRPGIEDPASTASVKAHGAPQRGLLVRGGFCEHLGNCLALLSSEMAGEVLGQQGISLGTGGRAQSVLTVLLLSTGQGDHGCSKLHLRIFTA